MQLFRPAFLAGCLWCCLFVPAAAAQDDGAWRPAQSPLATRWATDVSPEHVHPEYPRPQMVRADWLNLNGLWDYAVAPHDAARPAAYEGPILVPFPIESALSGIMRRVDAEDRIWYRRTFEVPAAWRGRRVLLHFGAVDWEAAVAVNGRAVGTHRGGYDPFSIDVTDALTAGGPQEVVVAVWDPTDTGPQPRGKQVHVPEDILYTPSSGIWQTVWLEPVPEAAVARLAMTPEIAGDHRSGVLHLSIETTGTEAAYEVEAVARDGGRVVAEARGPVGRPLALPLAAPKLWAPETPFLYDLRVRLVYDGTVVDSVDSYFGMRTVGLGPDAYGTQRLLLNGTPVFHFGPLDQGYWPDGLYTAPTDDALRYDLEVAKRLGFNMVRKHVKVEPARWYYWADRLGLMVWQDMPSGDAYVEEGRIEIDRTPASARQFERELRAMIDAFYNHPSVVMWVVFNESWGQYDTERLTRWTMRYDTTRLVNSASGWNDVGAGHVHDIHAYPGPNAPPAEPGRAVVLGEYGGLGLPLAGHTWQDEKNWGYQSYGDADSLEAAYLGLLNAMEPLLRMPGLSAAVYTQTTDVEVEVNGFMTYDRAVLKVDPGHIAAANRALYPVIHRPPPVVEAVAATAEGAAQAWRYTTEAPAGDWYAPGFDDRAWNTGPAGFGNDVATGPIRTPWTTPDLWLRRTFTLQHTDLEAPYLKIFHDGGAEVYLNGRRIDVPGWTDRYRLLRLDDAARAALRPGANTLAVHVRNNSGGQFIDAGIINLKERQP